MAIAPVKPPVARPAPAPPTLPGSNTLILSAAPFMSAVATAIKHLTPGSVLLVQVVTKLTDSATDLATSLRSLRPFLSAKAVVVLAAFPPPPSSVLQQYSAACGVSVTALSMAAFFQLQTTDMAFAQAVFGTAPNPNAGLDRWQIMKNTQDKIFQITQDVTANKAQTAGTAFAAMDGYIRG